MTKLFISTNKLFIECKASFVSITNKLFSKIYLFMASLNSFITQTKSGESTNPGIWLTIALLLILLLLLIFSSGKNEFNKF